MSGDSSIRKHNGGPVRRVRLLPKGGEVLAGPGQEVPEIIAAVVVGEGRTLPGLTGGRRHRLEGREFLRRRYG